MDSVTQLVKLDWQIVVSSVPPYDPITIATGRDKPKWTFIWQPVTKVNKANHPTVRRKND